MTRSDFVKPAFSLRTQRFVKTHALSLLGTKNLRFSAFRFHDFQRRIIRGVVSKDHVHNLVSTPPNLACSEIMRRIKGRTSSYLLEAFPHLKKRYWRGHFLDLGHLCATVGQITDKMIQYYLDHHFEPIPDDNFKMEPNYSQLSEKTHTF